MNEEVWKNIEGFDYSISNMGRVRSNKSGRLIKPWKLRQGYLQVGLMRERKRIRFLVHRLVAEAFLMKEVYQNEVNHIDLNKSNNNVFNLEWVSKEENLQHASLSGALRKTYTRYSDEFIEEVLRSKAGMLETCRIFHIHPSTLHHWRKKFECDTTY